MADKQKDLSPPERPRADASAAEVAEFNKQRLEYEEQRAQAQKEAAEKSPQVQDAP